MVAGRNGPRIRKLNELLVLDLVRRKGPVSRPTLAEQLNLEFQTVSTLCNKLMASGMLLEEGFETGRARQARAVVVNPSAAYSLGAEITRSRVNVVLIAFDGTILGRRSCSIKATPEQIVDEIAASAAALTSELSIDWQSIAGFGVSVPGPIDRDKGWILNPPNFEQWHQFPVRNALSTKTGLPVWMENTATSAALGEQWTGRGRDSDNFMFVYMGSGVGAGIVTQGRLLRGATGNAGEIAHMTTDPHGPLCSCGRRGCLVQYASTHGLLHLMQRAYAEQKNLDPQLADPMPTNVNDALAGDPPAWLKEVVDEACAKIGHTVSRVANLFDVETIVYGGPLTDILGDGFTKATEQALEQLPTFGRSLPDVWISEMAGDAGRLGAASLPFHAQYSPWEGAMTVMPPNL